MPSQLTTAKYCSLLLAMFLFTLSSFKSVESRPDKQISDPDLHAIRKQLVSALDNKQTTDSLYNSLAAIKNRSALINGYMATLQALKAKHVWNPLYKIKYLNDSETTFKAAVARDPHNIEIRFMRFSIEHNLPKFLGYDDNLNSDRLEMIKQIENKNYAAADQRLVKVIVLFLIDSKRCTASETNKLQQQLAAL